ncbi:protease complex subunit PrcB family protein [Flavobacterium piscinae]|uniref:Protease complex subunit PrcB family protein n=2 Tax=Flavobacterium piscinae TaxID=2506424 RepID=A0A4Q1KMP5_9FLAO|nr:protease complex subunit PrcB family protein [Flavobacterium piscinae]RXR31271.1 protease complex subunit PrcB family protein [Flavobacterium piscinae]
MKKIIATMTVCIILFSCSTQKNTDEKPPLYEILKQSEQGGANFRFFEMITEQKEFKMLLNDKDLKNKIKPSDIYTSNFLLLNMGEKNSGGYSFSIENIEETDNDIIITIKENVPKGLATTVMTYPICIVKINSKKNIIIQ